MILHNDLRASTYCSANKDFFQSLSYRLLECQRWNNKYLRVHGLIVNILESKRSRSRSDGSVEVVVCCVAKEWESLSTSSNNTRIGILVWIDCTKSQESYFSNPKDSYSHLGSVFPVILGPAAPEVDVDPKTYCTVTGAEEAGPQVPTFPKYLTEVPTRSTNPNMVMNFRGPIGAESWVPDGTVLIIFSKILMHVFWKAKLLAASAAIVALLSCAKILKSDRAAVLAEVTNGPPLLFVLAR